MSIAVEDDLLRQNPFCIQGASAERTAERPLLRWDEATRRSFLAVVTRSPTRTAPIIMGSTTNDQKR